MLSYYEKFVKYFFRKVIFLSKFKQNINICQLSADS